MRWPRFERRLCRRNLRMLASHGGAPAPRRPAARTASWGEASEGGRSPPPSLNMPEFLEYGFMHRAFVAGAITALICPAIGVFLVPRRLSLIADSLSHVALAVFLSGGFALAVVLISLAGGFNADLFAVLFGSILTVSPTDVWLILGLGAVVGVTIGTFYRQLLAITLNEELARTSGVPVAGLNLLLTVLTARS